MNPSNMEQPSPEFSILIVSWHVGPLLIEALDAVRDAMGQRTFEVIVVDNHSQDDTCILVSRHHPDAILIRNDRNHGFAVANNQALQKARGQWVLFLNPDTQITKRAIDNMLAVMTTHASVGLVGPRIVDQAGRVSRACRRAFPNLPALFLQAFLVDQFWQHVTERINSGGIRYGECEAVDCISGACMLGSREVMVALGGFDERIPMYLDDNDLCRRVKKHGLKVWYEGSADVIHHGGASVSSLPNPRMSSLMCSLAMDVYFIKHGTKVQLLGHHVLLAGSSLLFLAVDAVIWLPSLLFDRSFVRHYAQKHLWSLVYALIGMFPKGGLPPEWPRSLWPFFKNDAKSSARRK